MDAERLLGSDPNKWRNPTEYERQILDRLLSQEFPGKAELKLQLQECEVRTISDMGTFAIRPCCTPIAPVVERIPVEAVADDLDGHGIHFLLHVIQGVASELEVFTDTAFPVIQIPTPEQLRVQVNVDRKVQPIPSISELIEKFPALLTYEEFVMPSQSQAGE